VPRNGWKLALALFDGKAFEVTGSDHTNKYVVVDDQSSTVRIQVKTPEELVG
jgi:hypothetical protein